MPPAIEYNPQTGCSFNCLGCLLSVVALSVVAVLAALMVKVVMVVWAWALFG